MNSPVIGILAASLAGLALGGAYFGGLWWTVRRAADARRPALLLTGSYLLRAALLAGGILLVGGRDWRHLIACLAGLLAARVLSCRLVVAVPTPLAAVGASPQPPPPGNTGGQPPCN